jgi:hypothetical protein
MSSDNPIWKQLKLSLERPYKDENGKPIQDVLDINPDGGYIYEPYVYNNIIIITVLSIAARRTPRDALHKN